MIHIAASDLGSNSNTHDSQGGHPHAPLTGSNLYDDTASMAVCMVPDFPWSRWECAMQFAL